MNKFCSNCGTQLEENSKFCSGCGNSIIQHNQDVPTLEEIGKFKPETSLALEINTTYNQRSPIQPKISQQKNKKILLYLLVIIISYLINYIISFGINWGIWIFIGKSEYMKIAFILNSRITNFITFLIISFFIYRILKNKFIK